MISVLNIAGIQICISSSFPYKVNKKLRTFLADIEERKADLTLSFNTSDDITIPDNILLLDTTVLWNQNYIAEDKITICITDLEIDKVVSKLQVNRMWNQAVITYFKNTPDVISTFLESIGEILFRNSILFHQGIVIHAAAIVWKGKGIMFSAPSGTGKTTQANLWKRYKGAKIINADRPAVRVIEDRSYVYGTLWNGSSTKFRNCSYPLAAIVIIKQAPENEVRKLDDKEAISMIMPRAFLPYYQEEIMNLALDNLEKIIEVTPVYELLCKPDTEAVELVYQCLK